MKLCLDIQSALGQTAGVGRYTRMLARHLAAQRGMDELMLFHFDFNRKGSGLTLPGVQQRAVRWVPGRLVQYGWQTLQFPPFDWFSGPADVYHFPNFIRPPLRRGRSVVTIHDAAFLRFPETLEEKNFRYLSRHILHTVRSSDAILCVSAFTARELEELMAVPSRKLHVIPPGLTTDIRRADDASIAAIRRKRELDRPYLLSVGTLEPRKNYPFLIEVFERLDFDGDLVIAGMKGWKTESILARHEASPRRDRIRFLEFVGDDELPALYSGAELFVMPSMYEGFGFPPLEAMQCGTPVLSAATGSLPEVLGDAAVMLEGFDAVAWADTIEGLLGDSARRAALIAAGARQASAYTWEKTAQRTWQVYRSLA